MLSKKLHDALNEQMNFEFYSAHAYMAMAAYCTAESYDGFANFFLVQAEEERFHAMNRNLGAELTVPLVQAGSCRGGRVLRVHRKQDNLFALGGLKLRNGLAGERVPISHGNKAMGVNTLAA